MYNIQTWLWAWNFAGTTHQQIIHKIYVSIWFKAGDTGTILYDFILKLNSFKIWIIKAASRCQMATIALFCVLFTRCAPYIDQFVDELMSSPIMRLLPAWLSVSPACALRFAYLIDFACVDGLREVHQNALFCSSFYLCDVFCLYVCSTSPPGGNQVDGLPPASKLNCKCNEELMWSRILSTVDDDKKLDNLWK